MKRIIFILLLINICLLKSQGTAGSFPVYESHYIISNPTAGVLTKNKLYSAMNLISFNDAEFIFQYGIYKDLNIGIGVNINNFIGKFDIDIPKIPGFIIKYRIIDEAKFYPAVLLGFSSQGRVGVISEKKYFEPSPGFYLALSKSFKHNLGNIFVHSGINYSLETELKKLNFWLGVEQSIGSFGSINFEYNPYLNEPKNYYYGKNGLFNLSIRASIGYGLSLEYKFINIFPNSDSEIIRNFGIEFIRAL